MEAIRLNVIDSEICYSGFTKGKLIAETSQKSFRGGFWRGAHSIRMGKKYLYLCIYCESKGSFAEEVLKFKKSEYEKIKKIPVEDLFKKFKVELLSNGAWLYSNEEYIENLKLEA